MLRKSYSIEIHKCRNDEDPNFCENDEKIENLLSRLMIT